MKPVRIVIFAKAPQPGFAKTRLIPALGSQGAADLARRLLSHTLNVALTAKVGSVELCVTPSVLDPVWQTLAVTDAVLWSDQGDGDLGERLARAAKRVIESGESVLLLGTDCPELGASGLQRAAYALQRADATLFPTADGGYALLGLNHFHPSLFEDIAWSTDTVAFETLCRLGQMGWSVQSHSMLHDIDEPADLKWLPAGWTEVLYT
ncbi:MAG: glycosyltransferase [Rugosibacter sp.]|nr:MAG: glycosyltransferase [Rugosibacter sp.]